MLPPRPVLESGTLARAAHDRDRPFRQTRWIALAIFGKLNDQLGDRSRRRAATTRNDLVLLVAFPAWRRWLPWASLGLRLRRTYDLEKIGLDVR